jgi:hypothetical protein
LGRAAPAPTKNGVADLMDDFERETCGFTFKIIPLLSNAQKHHLRAVVRRAIILKWLLSNSRNQSCVQEVRIVLHKARHNTHFL